MNRWTLDDLNQLEARVAALEAVIKPPPPAPIDLPRPRRRSTCRSGSMFSLEDWMRENPPGATK